MTKNVSEHVTTYVVTSPRFGENRGLVYTKDVRGGRHNLDQAEVKEVVVC